MPLLAIRQTRPQLHVSQDLGTACTPSQAQDSGVQNTEQRGGSEIFAEKIHISIFRILTQSWFYARICDLSLLSAGVSDSIRAHYTSGPYSHGQLFTYVVLLSTSFTLMKTCLRSSDDKFLNSEAFNVRSSVSWPRMISISSFSNKSSISPFTTNSWRTLKNEC